MLTLIVVGYVCRRILHLDESPALRRGLAHLSPEREGAYQVVTLEIETQTVILGISLNEALGERESGDPENAWRLVRLAMCQWDRLAEIVTVVLNITAHHLPYARSGLVVRAVDTRRFRSRGMQEFVAVGDTLDQLIVRSKQRCQFHVRVLHRAADALTADFRRAYRAAERTPKCRGEIWGNLDPAFQDFDLIIKESLITLRNLLAALPDSALRDFVSDLNSVVAQGVRAKVATAAGPREA
ncbi:MAG: hypothetical protein ACRD1N_03860 [Terriglobia bacterium]